jgi:hypothetical protein
MLVLGSQMHHVELDWSKQLISDIYSVDAASPCEGDDQPAITQEWFGANHLCVDHLDKFQF